GRGAGAGRWAASLELPSWQRRVDSLALAARWDSPRAYLDRLELGSPLIEVERLQGSYDVASELGELELEADARLDAVADRFDLDLDLSRLGERARVSLDARGGPRALALDLDLLADAGAP